MRPSVPRISTRSRALICNLCAMSTKSGAAAAGGNKRPFKILMLHGE